MALLTQIGYIVLQVEDNYRYSYNIKYFFLNVKTHPLDLAFVEVICVGGG